MKGIHASHIQYRAPFPRLRLPGVRATLPDAFCLVFSQLLLAGRSQVRAAQRPPVNRVAACWCCPPGPDPGWAWATACLGSREDPGELGGKGSTPATIEKSYD